MSYFLHLVARFFGSLRPGGPSSSNVAWVKSVLTDAEFARWLQLSGPDRRHSVAVARDVQRQLGESVSPIVLRAALLHDSGKLEAQLHTPGRVLATVIGFRRTPAQREEMARQSGLRGRIGRYLCHPTIGADALTAINSDPLVVEWTRQHHFSPTECTVEPEYATALRNADND